MSFWDRLKVAMRVNAILVTAGAPVNNVNVSPTVMGVGAGVTAGSLIQYALPVLAF